MVAKNTVKLTKYLEPVPPVPVPTLLDHLPGLGQVGLDQGVVHEEEPDADGVEDHVHAVADAHGLLQGLGGGLHGRGLVADLGEVLGLGQEGVADLALALGLLGVRDLGLQLGQAGLVLLLKLRL